MGAPLRLARHARTLRSLPQPRARDHLRGRALATRAHPQNTPTNHDSLIIAALHFSAASEERAP